MTYSFDEIIEDILSDILMKYDFEREICSEAWLAKAKLRSDNELKW